ncbi:hypothetical protein SAMN05443637_111111 [Pseudonocardia thermophila]|jgi:hypothetical protein|uniref:Uncharacterized protein n=1 Tax=Pseudonocardia thermophila TaxID=1848 RepID=A0A1M6V080_PSETH|nr:hypothetical protein [Pseudonocardia thermophila]SHK74716.1 hypothetical protein SAMN05443637_111111 [Pseudonocardia thermophila]
MSRIGEALSTTSSLVVGLLLAVAVILWAAVAGLVLGIASLIQRALG